MTLNLTSMNISCGSLCTFGGCYISGGLGNFQRKLIPPQSCYICNEGTVVCSETLSSFSSFSSCS